MAEISVDTEALHRGEPAPLVRIFGWLMLTLLVAFMANNVLTVGFGFPGTRAAFAGGGGSAYLQLGLYLAAVIIAVLFVLGSSQRSLRHDAKIVSDFNAFLIRGCFWTVLC